MMRILIDMESLPWQISEIITQKNNDITQKNKGIHKSYRVSRRIGEVTYELMQKLLPRHVKIIKNLDGEKSGSEQPTHMSTSMLTGSVTGTFITS